MRKAKLKSVQEEMRTKNRKMHTEKTRGKEKIEDLLLLRVLSSSNAALDLPVPSSYFSMHPPLSSLWPLLLFFSVVLI